MDDGDCDMSVAAQLPPPPGAESCSSLAKDHSATVLAAVPISVAGGKAETKAPARPVPLRARRQLHGKARAERTDTERLNDLATRLWQAFADRGLQLQDRRTGGGGGASVEKKMSTPLSALLPSADTLLHEIRVRHRLVLLPAGDGTDATLQQARLSGRVECEEHQMDQRCGDLVDAFLSQQRQRRRDALLHEAAYSVAQPWLLSLARVQPAAPDLLAAARLGLPVFCFECTLAEADLVFAREDTSSSSSTSPPSVRPDSATAAAVSASSAPQAMDVDSTV